MRIMLIQIKLKSVGVYSHQIVSITVFENNCQFQPRSYVPRCQMGYFTFVYSPFMLELHSIVSEVSEFFTGQSSQFDSVTLLLANYEKDRLCKKQQVTLKLQAHGTYKEVYYTISLFVHDVIYILYVCKISNKVMFLHICILFFES